MKRHRPIHNQPKSKFNFFKKVNIFKFLSIFLIILFILFIPTAVKRLIRITEIECNSQFGPCEEQFRLGDYKFVKDQIEKELKQNIQVSSYLIQYKIPSTFKVDIVLKKPKYSIKNLLGVFYLVSQDGSVLEVLNESNMPYLTSNSTYTLGQKISEKDTFALKLFEKVKLINTVVNAEVKNDALEVKIENGILVKFPLEGDIDVLVGSLRLIFSRLNDETNGIRMEDVSEIDLRFKNPVIR